MTMARKKAAVKAQKPAQKPVAPVLVPQDDEQAVLAAILAEIEASKDDPVKLDGYERLFLTLLAQQEDSPQGFAAFYKLVHGNDLPDHGRKWIEHIYNAKSADRGVLIFAWRGSWKTTTISVTFTAWRIGKEPHRANLVIQANDDKSGKTTAQIADIIENNGGFRAVFPHVAPDKERGWGAAGYEVKRTDMEYPAWRELNSTRKDPSLVGLGISSKSLIGSHPDGVLLLDDIHDEENTSSTRERQAVINKVTGTIMPFVVEDAGRPAGERMSTWFIAVGTPWTEDDAYNYLKTTGEYEFLKLPVAERVAEGEPGAIEIGQADMTVANHNDLYGWWRLEWPERFDKKTLVTWRNRTGKREFARMYLLDLQAAKETGLKYMLFPSEKIDPRWPAGGGIDYASTIEIRGKRMEPSQRSKFAMAYGQKTPANKAVIVDGVSGHFSQAQAEAYAERAQGIFPNWNVSGVEMNGKGEEFYSLLSRKPYLRLFPFWTGGQSKRNRQERVLGPWLEMGFIMISDADTPFLNALRKALDDWPNGDMDEIDSVYAYAQTIPDVLAMPTERDESEDGGAVNWGAPKRKANPWAALGRVRT
jgi:hypothetical protein